MSNNNNLTSLGDALANFSNQRKMKQPILEVRVVAYWKEIMGDLTQRYTEKIYLQNKTLFVKVGPNALKNELMYSTEKIIKRYNTHFGDKIISKIVLL